MTFQESIALQPRKHVVTIPHEIEKAITLLASLPSDDAVFFLGQLSSLQINELAEYVTLQENISAEQQHTISAEIVDRATNELTVHPQAAQSASVIFSENNDQQLSCPLESTPLSSLAHLDADEVCALIHEELPQTIAFVLHHLPENTVGHILQCLRTDKQTEVIKRLADLNNDLLSSAVLEDVTSVLTSRLAQRRRPLQPQATGTLRIACLLNDADQATERSLLENLFQEDRNLVHAIQPALLVLRHLDRLRQDRVRSTRCA